jgi:ATP-dependent protease ClpP protease subunit
LAIVDTIDAIKTPVHTYCDKLAGSMALVILTRGRRGERSARESASLSFAMLQAIDETRRADAERFGGILIGKVSEATGISQERVRQMFLDAASLNGNQAAQAGLIDKVE